MMTNKERIKLGDDLDNMTKTDGFRHLAEYIAKEKEAIKEASVNPGFKDFETYKGYVKAYEAYLSIEDWIARHIEAKNKLIQTNEESETVAPAGPVE
jgi:hypothetical protein